MVEYFEKLMRDKIAQMLVLGFKGVSIHDDADIAQMLLEVNLGGVILFDYDCATNQFGRNIINPQQLRTLTSQLKHFASQGANARGHVSSPLLIGVDYEGGEVTRLRDEYGFPKTLSAYELAQLDDETSDRYYCRMAEAMFEHGLNVNFAPVVDLALNAQNPVIARRKRAYSADENVVRHQARRFIEAFKAKGILCSLKHFPGHGSSHQDTHHGFVDITSCWDPIELEPYRRLLKCPQLVDMVMTAHVFHQELDPDHPATLSKKLVTGLLREKLGFTGVVVTDDLQMAAIADAYDLQERVLLAIEAGCDLLVFGNQLGDSPVDANTLINMIEELIRDGQISAKRIEQSYQRIMHLKSRFIEADHPAEALPCERFAQTIMR